jgi:hypothetical protein
MRKIIFLLLLVIPCGLFAQIGLRAGINFANVSKASDIDNSSRSGFNAAIFLAPKSKGILSSRTELIFSRQGYDYKSGSNTGNVNLDYIMLPQYMSINITKYFSILIGAQMAFLINAKADSTSNTGMTGQFGSIMSLYNKFDYGYGGGVEIHPFMGLLIGARVNISLGNLYKTPEPGEQPSSFVPKVDVKNNLFQIYAGWKFGGNKKKEKEKEKEK